MIPNEDTLHAEGPFIIAEVGVNHDGDPGRAVELVDRAADAGADAVKFQWFDPERLVSRSAGLVDYQRASGESDPRSMLGRLALDRAAMELVVDRARSRGLKAVITVFSRELVSEAASLDWDLFKTASPDLVNRPLLEALDADGRPLILSTGGSTIEEIEEALGWLGRTPHGLLHCVSSYPTPAGDAALGAIAEIRARFGGRVGYSDHTRDWRTGGLAVAAGAVILEKHLTWNVDASGPDHAASLDPDDFTRYVAFARLANDMLGSGRKDVLPTEREVRENARQSVAAASDLVAGAPLRSSDLTTMRPGTGLRPAEMAGLVGRRLARDVPRGTLLHPDDFTPMETLT